MSHERLLGAFLRASGYLARHCAHKTRFLGLRGTPIVSQAPAVNCARNFSQFKAPAVFVIGQIHQAALSTGAAEASAPEQEDKPANQIDLSDDPFLRNADVTKGPLAYYKENRLSGFYKRDPKQESTILKLQELYENLRAALRSSKRRPSGLTLVDHAGTSKGHHSWWSDISSFLSDGEATQMAPPKIKGLYMFGGVGTGKTMLMDLLVNAAPVYFQLRRMHFHDFMLEVHSMLKQYARQADPLLQVADALAQRMRVLCLDELFVTDVADAAILNRLFGRLWDKGVVLVATSNRHPDALYEGGLQRNLFLPFIERLKRETDVHDMASPVDYRKLAHHTKGVFYIPADGPDPDAELTERFAALAAAAGDEPPKETRIAVQMGRQLHVPLAGPNMCLMTFKELCSNNLGAADYIALASSFHTLALRGIPIFDASTKSEAYRFVTLVDVLYENRIRLFCSAAGLPADLFQNVMSMADAKQLRGTSQDNADLLIDDNLAFSKDRTISRLTEMESKEYMLEHAKRRAPCLLLALEERGGAEKAYL